MATASVTPDNDTVLAEIQIAAPPERVFQAITDPRQMLQWWGQAEMYRTTKFEIDLRINGKWMSAGINASGESFQVGGEYLEIDPPRLAKADAAKSHAEGWQQVLAWMQAFVEKGETIDNRR